MLDLQQESTFEKFDISTKFSLQKCLNIEKDVMDSNNIATINTADIFRKTFFILQNYNFS